jgi:signal transduction histidine kinase
MKIASLVGIVAAFVTGYVMASGAARRAHRERLSALRHDIRRSLTVIRGEVEVVLSAGDVPAVDRETSSVSVINEVEQVDELLRGLL